MLKKRYFNIINLRPINARIEKEMASFITLTDIFILECPFCVVPYARFINIHAHTLTYNGFRLLLSSGGIKLRSAPV